MSSELERHKASPGLAEGSQGWAQALLLGGAGLSPGTAGSPPSTELGVILGVCPLLGKKKISPEAEKMNQYDEQSAEFKGLEP